MTQTAPEWLLTRLAAAGIRAEQAWIESQQLFLGRFEGALSELTIHAFRRGMQTSLVEQARIGWAYLALEEHEGELAGKAATLCRQVARILEPSGDEILALLEAPEPNNPSESKLQAPLPIMQPDITVGRPSVFEDLRSGPYVEYPSCVNLETLAVCPAKCTFCTYPTLERKGTRMSDALLDKVLTDLEAIPRSVPFVLFPFLLSEPFAERRLDAILERAEHRLPSASIDLVTTGTLLDDERRTALLKRKNVREVCISLNFIDPKDYELEMGLPWERTWRNLQGLKRVVASGEAGFRVLASRVATSDEGDARFREFVGNELPGFEVRVYDRHDWLGKVPGPKRALDHLPCTQWFELKVAVTGKIALCCQDSHVEHALGDVNTTSLLEIYNAPFARARRQALSPRSQFEPCRGCSFINGASETDTTGTLPSWFPAARG